jgi:basic membrane protein A
MGFKRGLPVQRSGTPNALRFLSTLRLPALALVLLLVAAACGSGDDSGGGGSAGTSTSEIKVGMVLPGPKNDKSFSQASYEGILRAEKEHGIKTQIRENVVDPTARLEALRDLAQSNNVVMAASAAFAESGAEVAPQFPNVTFIILNGEASDAPNLYAYALREGVPAYIAGLVASQSTKSGKVGFLGGEEIPSTLQAQKGFKAGAEASGKPVQVQGTILGSFNDVEKARLSAAAQIKDGVDYIYSHLDAAVAGVIRAFEQAGGEGGTFNIIAPRCEKHVIGTSIADVSALIASMVGDYKNKTLPAERSRLVGVEDPKVQRFELCPDYKTPELQKLVDDTTKGINDGTIKLVEGI